MKRYDRSESGWEQTENGKWVKYKEVKEKMDYYDKLLEGYRQSYDDAWKEVRRIDNNRMKNDFNLYSSFVLNVILTSIVIWG